MRRQPLALVAALTAVLATACSSSHRGAGSVPSSTTASSVTTAPAEPSDTTSPPARQAGWLTYDHDSERSGVDPTSPPPGAASAIREAWTSPTLDAAVYAQPLVTPNAVVVATENDTVYSLDPSTGAIRWRRHLATPVAGSSLPCGNVDPSGITGTPVIDQATQLIWVVTFSANPYAHTLWAVRLTDGTVAASRPADPPGADPATDQQRGALTLGSGRVYIPYGGLFGDCGDYHGHVLGLSTATGTAATATRPLTYTTPAARAGIWAPPGPVLDGSGDLLIATGNGTPVSPPGDANSVIRLTPDLAVAARFTAPDTAALSESDRDLGSTSPTIVNGDVVETGKEGVAYLLAPDLHLLASAHVCAGGFGGTALAGDTVMLSCFDGLYALQVGGTSITTRWKDTGIRPGPPIVAGGIVWAVDRGGRLVGYDTQTGRLAYSHAVAVAGSFPTLAAYNGALYVLDGDRVAAFTGV